MLYYIILFVVVVFSLFIKKGIMGRLLPWVGLLMMFLLTCFRGTSVGTDTLNYMYYNDEYRTTEYLNLLLVYLKSVGILSERGMIQSLAVITYICIALIPTRYKISPRIFFFFFLISNIFASGLNVSRQVASVSILAVFIPFIFEKKFAKSLIFFVGIALAAGFHLTSLFFLFFYFFRYVSVKDNILQAVILVIAPLILLGFIPLEQIIQSFMPKEYLAEYSKSVTRSEAVTLLGFFYRLLNIIIQAYLLSFFKNQHLKLFFVFSIINLSSSMGLDTVVSRVFMINTLLMAISYSHVFSNLDFKKNNVGYGVYLFLVLFGIYFAYNGIASNPDLNNYIFYNK